MAHGGPSLLGNSMRDGDLCNQHGIAQLHLTACDSGDNGIVQALELASGLLCASIVAVTVMR
ncbi:hypothetical protein BAUCODRAFT_185838 [Baudoinia panamericana UAMH 10762]|uniref:Uncharacterized protein n=1 Tax=Baudoinia panamericana (strain UAMH 10762) TaxID=717646 RepID=M2NNL2_BAUPA|nr:uncharacterized protein BAUCODRAFT_185838 [Baudoinia panamericana UAMH 10762]EMD00826.1 hypothetical protein BAUCODRAFT_185838 [Baudoinia panamericana UAMH 10762]